MPETRFPDADRETLAGGLTDNTGNEIFRVSGIIR